MTDTKGRKLRQDQVALLKEKIDSSKSVIFTDYKGLTAQQMSDLRLLLRDQGADAAIAKNTLLKIALEQDIEELKGPTLAVFSHEDPIAGIKILFEYAEQHEEKPVVKAGIVEGNLTNAADLQVLSKLPSRDELIAKVVGGLKTPLNNIVGVLGGVQRNFVYAIAEIAKQKESN